VKLILASNSPRRRELLGLLGWEFSIQAADLDESRLPGEAPAAYVLRLARAKALACRGCEGVVVAADTAVVDGESILGKPREAAEAKRMLRQLRGHTHQVFTGIAVLLPADGNPLSDLCVTDVPMRAYSDMEMEAYIASGDPLDKAGAYAIQHAGFNPVESLSGCFASVMGLPLCHLSRLLRGLGANPPADVPARCQAALAYTCPIHARVLRGEKVG
jgi:septum formation protein